MVKAAGTIKWFRGINNKNEESNLKPKQMTRHLKNIKPQVLFLIWRLRMGSWLSKKHLGNERK